MDGKAWGRRAGAREPAYLHVLWARVRGRMEEDRRLVPRLLSGVGTPGAHMVVRDVEGKKDEVLSSVRAVCTIA